MTAYLLIYLLIGTISAAVATGYYWRKDGDNATSVIVIALLHLIVWPLVWAFIVGGIIRERVDRHRQSRAAIDRAIKEFREGRK